MQQTSRRRVLLAAFSAALALAPAAGAWSWPADGPVLQPFVFDPAHPYAAGQHRGIDLGAEAGTIVVAPAAGTVTFAGTVPASGKSLTITTADGYAVTLTHLGSFSVAAGASLAEGDPVGTVGPSGEPELAQPYVHLGIRLAAAPEGYVDPLTMLPPRPVAGPPAPPPAAGLAPVPGVPAVPATDPAPSAAPTGGPVQTEPTAAGAASPAVGEPAGLSVPPTPHTAAAAASNLTLVGRRPAPSEARRERRPGGKQPGAPASAARLPLRLVARPSGRAGGVEPVAAARRRQASSHAGHVTATPPRVPIALATAGRLTVHPARGGRSELRGAAPSRLGTRTAPAGHCARRGASRSSPPHVRRQRARRCGAARCAARRTDRAHRSPGAARRAFV